MSPGRRRWLVAAAAVAVVRRAAASADPSPRWWRLRDMDALAGGLELWVSGAGTAHLRLVGPQRAGAAREERRHAAALTAAEQRALQAALPALLGSDPARPAPGLPGEPWVQLDVERDGLPVLTRIAFKGREPPALSTAIAALGAIAGRLRGAAAASAPRPFLPDWHP